MLDLAQLRELDHEKARECFQSFVDEHFHNNNGRRVVTRIPAEKSDTDVYLGEYLRTVATALPTLLDALAAAEKREKELTEQNEQLGAQWLADVMARNAAEFALAAERERVTQLENALRSYQTAMREQYEPSPNQPCTDCDETGKCSWCNLYLTAELALAPPERKP